MPEATDILSNNYGISRRLNIGALAGKTLGAILSAQSTCLSNADRGQNHLIGTALYAPHIFYFCVLRGTVGLDRVL
jgi:hypothetical protein